jgi:two-component system sensor histidine kinase MtrB
MTVTAVSTGRRQRSWIIAFRRSTFGRAIIRRLPSRVKRWLRAGRRWQRGVVAQVKTRWHRSLQLRVVSTTLVLSVLVIAVLGFFLVQSIAGGLLTSAEKSADSQVSNGLLSALGQSTVNVLAPPPPRDPGAAVSVAKTTARALQQASGRTGSYYLVFIQLTNIEPATVHWVAQTDVNIPLTIPSTLISKVAGEQASPSHRYNNQNIARPLYEPTTLVYNPGQGTSVPALAVGVPLGTYYQLYYVFPFTQQQATLLLVQRILVGVGLALVVLLAAIASLVTRWVVLPVRHAAQAAQRLSAGHLGERMQVLGVDDLAALATSFNEMAASLQGKLRELEELSNVQRQFVSDVSHELRTPLSTIKVAAEVLFESRGALDAELVDVCDLVRRSADDAQQLAERRGSRIEFRLPATGCFAEADRRRVERILRNILVNAVEHGEGKDVVVTTAIDSDAVAVSVRDYGVGLRPGEEHKVFDRFWRGDPARARTTGGSGLGLAISLEDARLHGGWLQAWGERGKGSVFRLTLPRVAGQELAGSPLPLGPDEAGIATSLSGSPYPANETTGVISRG